MANKAGVIARANMISEIPRDPVTGRLTAKWPGLRCDTAAELPKQWGCGVCETVKPIEHIRVVRVKRTGKYRVYARCADCINQRERGRNREYKRTYQRNWRKKNRALNRSYWDNPTRRAQVTAYAAQRFADDDHRNALSIQRRLRKRLGQLITLVEARELLRRFGPCYPTRYGLTAKGLRECERLRSKQRKKANRLRLGPVQIRMMVYEDGYFIKPGRQPIRIYPSRSRNLVKWHERRKLQTQERKAA